MGGQSNPKFTAFNKKWDTEYMEIIFEGIEGDFYPNEKGLVVLRKLLNEEASVINLIVDGDFDLRDNFDDEFYAFAYLNWENKDWKLKSFRYDEKTNTETEG